MAVAEEIKRVIAALPVHDAVIVKVVAPNNQA